MPDPGGPGQCLALEVLERTVGTMYCTVVFEVLHALRPPSRVPLAGYQRVSNHGRGGVRVGFGVLPALGRANGLGDPRCMCNAALDLNHAPGSRFSAVTGLGCLHRTTRGAVRIRFWVLSHRGRAGGLGDPRYMCTVALDLKHAPGSRISAVSGSARTPLCLSPATYYIQ